MKLKLQYIEGQHDEVSGVLRYLAHNVSGAQEYEASIANLGGRSIRQELSVEIPGIYSHLEMEAALCVWEHLCDITVNADKPDPAWTEYREGVGSVELRHESIKIGKWALQVYDELPQWYRESGAYDWEIIPAIVGELTPGAEFPSHYETAARLVTTPVAKAEYLRSANWHLKNRYGIDFIEGAGLTEEEFFTGHFDPAVEPKQMADWYAEKYGLEKIR